MKQTTDFFELPARTGIHGPRSANFLLSAAFAAFALFSSLSASVVNPSSLAPADIFHADAPAVLNFTMSVLDEGSPKPRSLGSCEVKLGGDKFHPNREGYRVWWENMTPLLAKALGASPLPPSVPK